MMEIFLQRARRLWVDPVKDVAAHLAVFHDARQPQHPQMMGNGRLAQTQLFCQ